MLTLDKYGRINFEAAERQLKSIESVNESRDISGPREEQIFDKANNKGKLLKRPRCKPIYSLFEIKFYKTKFNKIKTTSCQSRSA